MGEDGKVTVDGKVDVIAEGDNFMIGRIMAVMWGMERCVGDDGKVTVGEEVGT